MKMKLVSAFVAGMLCLSTGYAQTMPYQNPDLSPQERAADLLGRLTLEEKVGLMGDYSEPVPRLGIKKFAWWSEALHGVGHQDDVTVFPEPIGMAASFNDDLVFQVFDVTSTEARARFHERERQGDERIRDNGLSVWTPNVNIFRDPRWGRGMETYGEDPYLTSRMGVAVVKGLQGPEDAKYRKLLACAKHYAVHSGPESTRHSLNINDLSARHLWETYLPAFKSLVVDADVREVMCAYQRLDDDPCCGNNRLLNRILREEWGFEYLVVTDCGAISDFYTSHRVSSDKVHAASKALLAGTDVECGSNYPFHELPDAVRRGLVEESDIDQSVMRLLIGRFELGDFDDNSIVPYAQIPASVINSKEHQALALEIARQSMTLLQNKNNILPLSKNTKIAVVGPNANDAAMMWGNYNGRPVQSINALEGIRSLARRNVFYDKACELVDDMMLESLIEKSSFEGKPGVKATYWNNMRREGEPVATEYYTNAFRLRTGGMNRFAMGVNPQFFSARYETVFIPEEDGEVVFKLESMGSSSFSVNGEMLARFGSWRSIPRRIPVAMEKGKEYKIQLDFTHQFDFADAGLFFSMGYEYPADYNLLVDKLKGIDVVIFVGGISPELEGEQMAIDMPGFKGGDRTDIELPASQRKCIQALADAGKKIIMVNCSGSPVALVPESENCEAILQAWYPGQAGGQAIAEVLFGDYNPAGKLPLTFYTGMSQIPEDFEEYDMTGRTYRYMTEKPLFPFGHGLSYSTFNVGQAQVDRTEMEIDDTMTLTLPVTNTSRRKGTEIIQVYIKKRNEEGPVKTLRAFERVELAPGETRQVVIPLDRTAFEWFNEEVGRVVTTSGEFDIFYGTSSDEDYLQKTELKLL
ncbi:MAG: glycoside hydrolase family 3 C-terminal domain-containing protein [Rikenellaceae bacterium]|jgi:beta-glucosidase|nr:glycoside hydrolase family 3 C-terminal domain-containing protein [Rikenellaceae bacterium]